MSMITAIQWVPRGFAAPFPTKYVLTEEEFERIAELAKLQLEEANEDLEDAKEAERIGESSKSGSSKNGAVDKESHENNDAEMDDPALDDDLKKYHLSDYDNDDDEGQGDNSVKTSIFGNFKSLTYFESNSEDPHIRLEEEQADEDEDRDDLQILATDNLLLAAKVEGETAELVVHVYEDSASNLYVHHDFPLDGTPLCLEWLDLPVNKQGVEKDTAGNFVAIGTMNPDIEIWDLDTVDSMYPNAILGRGGHIEGGRDKKKKNKAKKKSDKYHVDAVLSLAANRKHRNLLASASADKTVKLWDLNTSKCAKSYSYHTDKVCSVAWHKVEATLLLSGSYDRTVVAADMRAPDAQVPRWGVESDVETVQWDPHDQNFFYVSTERGIIHYHDVRAAPKTPTATKAVWTLQAHDDVLSSFDANPVIPGFLATGSFDKTVKLWNIQPTGPTMVVSRSLDVGKVFATTFAPDQEVAFRLAVAGSRGTMHVWDTSTNKAVRNAFAGRVPDVPVDAGEDRLVGVDDASSESDDDEGGADIGGGNGGESMDEDED